MRWRLRTRFGDDLVVVPHWEARAEDPALRVPALSLRFELRDWLLGWDSFERRLLLEMYGEIGGLQADPWSSAPGHLHRQALPMLEEAFKRGTLMAFKLPVPKILAPSAPKEEVVPAAPPEAAPSDDAEPTIRLVTVEAPTFVPGAETIAISYAIDGPLPKASSVRMIVKSQALATAGNVVRDQAVPGPYSASGTVSWDGSASTTSGLITLKGSPYDVTFVLTSTSGKTSTSADGRIRLQIEAAKIFVQRTPAPLDVPDPWKPAVDALIAELARAGMPGDCQGRLIIDSPVFKARDAVGPSGLTEMDYNESYTEYKAAIGDGAPVPLACQITLKAKAGPGKRAPRALDGTRVLWDFRLEASGDLGGSLGERGVDAPAKAFMKRVASNEESATQPKGVAAHVRVGGWRTKNPDRAAAGYQWKAAGSWSLQ